MRKILTIFIIIFSLLIISSCKKEESSAVVISKLFTATRTANNVIELYNNSDKDESLSSYKLDFYQNASDEVTATINLNGVIKANSFYVITGANFGITEQKEKVDFIYDEGSLPFNGDDAIVLVKNKTVIDVIGHIGLPLNFSKDLTFIRLGEKSTYIPFKEYDPFNFIPSLPDVFEYIKNDNHEIQTLEDLYKGPRLEDRYLDLPYKDPEIDNAGAGGTFLATLQSIADGDTATFRPVDGEDYTGFATGKSIRYYYINTPEVQGTMDAEPWGYVASRFNKEYQLKEAHTKEIRLQSIPGYALTETYGRNLGLVWINGSLSQFLIVSEGLSDDVPVSYSSIDLLLSYKNVPYLTFLRFAENRARVNGWGTFGYPNNLNGEVAPDWDFGLFKTLGDNFTWEPHLKLPWE